MKAPTWLGVSAVAVATHAAQIDRSGFGDHDLWVYTAVWTPHVCTTTDVALCASPTSSMRTSLVSSTLIPTYTDGTAQTGICRYEYGEFLPSSIAAAGGANTLQQYWPFLLATDVGNMWDGGYTGSTPTFDWTCSGMHQVQYLREMIALGTKVSSERLPFVADHVGHEAKTSDVRAIFQAAPLGWNDIVLSCDSHSFLDKVSVCFAKTVNATTKPGEDPYFGPAQVIPCPQSIRVQDTCHADVVRFAAFPAKYST